MTGLEALVDSHKNCRLFFCSNVSMEQSNVDTSAMPHDNIEAKALQRDGLAEAQLTVRNYDTRAQIVGVGYILSLGVVGQVFAILNRVAQISPIGI